MILMLVMAVVAEASILILCMIFFIADANDFSVPNVAIPQGGIPVTICEPVLATQDEIVEGDHDFSINIASTNQPSFVTVVMPDTTPVTIMDDDGMLQGIVIRAAYTVAVMYITDALL